MSRRARFAALVLSVVVLLSILDTAYEASMTLKRLDVIEAERDRWQQPSDILRALGLKSGDVVVDFGSGAGYFALKLSSAVGPTGKVLAVDIRPLSLSFLWIRALMKHTSNIEVMLTEPDRPRLPPGSVNAVLVLNTYHELSNPSTILDRILQCLVPEGRLVVVDPTKTEHGQLAVGSVASQLIVHGFQIVSSQDRLTEYPSGLPWWLISARKH